MHMNRKDELAKNVFAHMNRRAFIRRAGLLSLSGAAALGTVSGIDLLSPHTAKGSSLIPLGGHAVYDVVFPGDFDVVLPDWDQISVSSNFVPGPKDPQPVSNKVNFYLRLGSSVDWWKGILL